MFYPEWFSSKKIVYQLFTLPQILEHKHWFQQPTMVCCIAFLAAFDSLGRQPLWHILPKDEIPEKYVRLSEAFCPSKQVHFRSHGDKSRSFFLDSCLRKPPLVNGLIQLRHGLANELCPPYILKGATRPQFLCHWLQNRWRRCNSDSGSHKCGVYSRLNCMRSFVYTAPMILQNNVVLRWNKHSRKAANVPSCRPSSPFVCMRNLAANIERFEMATKFPGISAMWEKLNGYVACQKPLWICYEWMSNNSHRFFRNFTHSDSVTFFAQFKRK